MTRLTITAQAKALAALTANAYSAERYGSWTAVAAGLLRAGFKPWEAEAVMRSKLARHAADETAYAYGRVPARVLVNAARREKRYVREILRATASEYLDSVSLPV